jgi:hypothetical protein
VLIWIMATEDDRDLATRMLNAEHAANVTELEVRRLAHAVLSDAMAQDELRVALREALDGWERNVRSAAERAEISRLRRFVRGR